MEYACLIHTCWNDDTASAAMLVRVAARQSGGIASRDWLLICVLARAQAAQDDQALEEGQCADLQRALQLDARRSIAWYLRQVCRGLDVTTAEANKPADAAAAAAAAGFRCSCRAMHPQVTHPLLELIIPPHAAW